jgi:hypothetical protein
MGIRSTLAAVSAGLIGIATPASAVTITFDDLVTGATSYAYDADGDTIADAIFSTLDPFGFNTVGPGTNQLYIQQPGIEGTQLLPVDLRVDFTIGAINSLGFGFAINAQGEQPGAVLFSVYGANNALLGSVLADASQGSSNFPEGLVSLAFSGTAAYATFDFLEASGSSRYIIDNFTGRFGSVAGIPEPQVWAQLVMGFGILGFAMRGRRTAVAA